MADALEPAIEIANEAREIGWLERKLVAADYDECPYRDELRRAAWQDGWKKARDGWFSATQKEAPVADALKPCPFCGGEAEMLRDDDGRWTQVHCTVCGARSNEWPNDELAPRIAWNRRAPLPSVEAVAREINAGLGESWAYSNYSGDEWNQCRDMLDEAARRVLALIGGEK